MRLSKAKTKLFKDAVQYIKDNNLKLAKNTYMLFSHNERPIKDIDLFSNPPPQESKLVGMCIAQAAFCVEKGITPEEMKRRRLSTWLSGAYEVNTWVKEKFGKQAQKVVDANNRSNTTIDNVIDTLEAE